MMDNRSPEERALAQWEREVRRARKEGRPPPPRPDAAGPPAGPPWPAEEEVGPDLTPAEPGPASWSAEDDRHAREWSLDQVGGAPGAWDAPGAASAGDSPPAIRRGLPKRRPVPPPVPAPAAPPAPMPAPAVPSAAAQPQAGWGTMEQRPLVTPTSVLPGAPGRRGGLTVGRVAALVALLVLIGVGIFLIELFQPFHGASGQERVNVRVPEGASARQIGDLLERRGVVSSSFFFSLRATLSGDRSKLRAGTFHLRRDMAYGVALSALTRRPAPAPTLSLTVPEGLWAREISARVKAKGVTGSYLSAAKGRPGFDPGVYGAKRPRTLEGFLFPDTYTLRKPATAEKLVDEQLATFRRRFAQIDLSYAKKHGLSPYEVVIVASLVEGEAATKGDRPKVAAVIYNRLKAGIPLFIDATLRYLLHDRQNPLTVSQLVSTSSYNTRKHQGLPPGPIGNPGLASLEAAAHPARADYLYFVVRPGHCGMAFTSSSAQFERDKARYAAERARLGRSPSTC